MSKAWVKKKGIKTNHIKLPFGVNEKEKQMFLAFAKSVNQSLFKV